MKSYIKKSLLIATTAMLVNPMAIASADVGNGLGVELILNEKFKGTPNASLYTVSHYNNVKSANKVYKGNNLTIELFADKVVYETYDDSKNANRLPSVMFSNLEDLAWQNKPFFSVVVSQAESDHFGGAPQPKTDAKFNPNENPLYQYGQHRFIALSYVTMYGGQYAESDYHIFAHEAGHALGALHEDDDYSLNDPNDDPYYINARAAEVCADGSKPLMVAGAWKKGDLPLITGSDNCPLLDQTKNPNGEVMQRYYNSTQQDGYTMSERTANTLGLTVTENINSQQFDFTVTRTGNSAESGTLFIAGNGIGLTPIDFSFAENETSKFISVDFAKLHELMTTSDNNYQNGSDIENTVYAVAQTASEVVKGAINVSDANTQWKSVPKDNEPQPEPQPDNGSSGGGSSSLGFLALITIFAYWRRKQ
ncbi:zinc-dependent metalloprotease family protein [Photobacterium leiognathi subsp. mandapamensis]|uniref:zinc-dependent metalloprotease family protein n=1 Tax=Photobacterium leiognathi TaxID=553611 RepID=UPI003BF50668